MKYCILIALLIELISTCYAQKPRVNENSYRNWTTVEDGEISPNGQYVFYRIDNEPQDGSTWVITATNKSWEYRSTRFSNLNFSPNSKFLYAMQGDSLIKLKLQTNEVTTIPNCKSYEIYYYRKSHYLIYTLNDAANSIGIKDLKNDFTTILSNVKGYNVNKNGGAIISKVKSITPGIETIQWTDLNTGRSLIVYEGTPIKDIIYDPSGDRMAFDITNSRGETEIWYYQRGKKSSEFIASDTSAGINKDLIITTREVWKFSDNGQDLLFNLTNKTFKSKAKDKGPDIWNYQDLYLLPELKKRGDYWNKGLNLSILNIQTKELKQILSGDYKVTSASLNNKSTNFIFVESSLGQSGDLTWNKSTHLSYYLYATSIGKLIPIKTDCTYRIYNMGFSPDNNYLVYYDLNSLQYLSYDIRNNKSEVISGKLKDELFYFHYNMRPDPKLVEGTPGIVGWIKGSNKVIVHGTYDLWELDLENKETPKNITKGYGQQNQLIFADLKDKILNDSKSWLLSAFKMQSKDEEIYSFDYKTGKLNFQFKTATKMAEAPTQKNINLTKAVNTNKYLLKLGNAQHSLNYAITEDFKKIDTLSSNFPEKKYNWLKSEPINYKDKLGRDCQARLYKPEDFDPTKKYPVIFNYYLESSNDLNEPLSLDPNGVGFNIPLLVSNGYVICMPNIYLEANKPGESALTSVLAAADYLKQFSWIDTTKMGITGHSHGGYETNYIVTHSNRFAAAIEAAGMSNFVEYYNSYNLDYGTSDRDYVRSAMVMTDGLENIPELYNNNSPILSTKNVSTPLLIVHNNGDGAVTVSHGIELFLQLRSQQKPVWFLQYDGEGHALNKLENKLDCQAKVKDFFDYYLKDKPMPDWMNNPIR